MPYLLLVGGSLRLIGKRPCAVIPVGLQRGTSLFWPLVVLSVLGRGRPPWRFSLVTSSLGCGAWSPQYRPLLLARHPAASGAVGGLISANACGRSGNCPFVGGAHVLPLSHATRAVEPVISSHTRYVRLAALIGAG